MISPVENNGMMLRTQDFSIMRGNEDRAIANQHTIIQNDIDKTGENAAHQVLRKDNSDGADTRHDARNEGKNKYYNNRKKKDTAVKKEGVMVKKSMGGFDITV